MISAAAPLRLLVRSQFNAIVRQRARLIVTQGQAHTEGCW